MVWLCIGPGRPVTVTVTNQNLWFQKYIYLFFFFNDLQIKHVYPSFYAHRSYVTASTFRRVALLERKCKSLLLNWTRPAHVYGKVPLTKESPWILYRFAYWFLTSLSVVLIMCLFRELHLDPVSVSKLGQSCKQLNQHYRLSASLIGR